jgi:hypothetical protein
MRVLTMAVRERKRGRQMKRTEIETLARFAACLLVDCKENKGMLPDISAALSSFTDPAEVLVLAHRAWAELEKNGGFVNDEENGT